NRASAPPVKGVLVPPPKTRKQFFEETSVFFHPHIFSYNIKWLMLNFLRPSSHLKLKTTVVRPIKVQHVAVAKTSAPRGRFSEAIQRGHKA
ncbi:hypothetical protein, partial [Primorskyibacter sp. 2E233]|uniref:hypothetical protein n=1 Tax=Primorskyibacter sp. 2E233 TaxID=3413431 RepID=UPI003BF3AEF3